MSQLDTLKRFVRGEALPLTRRAADVDGHVVVLSGGKGGVGTTTLVSLLGLGVWRRGHRVLVVNGTEAPSSLHRLFGIDAPGASGELRSGAAQPDELAVEPRDGLALLCAGPDEEEVLQGGRSVERQGLWRRLRSFYGRFDLVLIDAGSTLAATLGPCAAGAGRLVVVTTADPMSTAASYALFKGVRRKVPDLALELLVNGENAAGAFRIEGHIRDALTRFGGGEVGFAGSVPADPFLRTRTLSGQTIQGASPELPSASAALDIGARLMTEIDRGERPRPGMRSAATD